MSEAECTELRRQRDAAMESYIKSQARHDDAAAPGRAPGEQGHPFGPVAGSVSHPRGETWTKHAVHAQARVRGGAAAMVAVGHGSRPTQEDCMLHGVVAVTDGPGAATTRPVTYLAVLDGHRGGATVATLAAALHRELKRAADGVGRSARPLFAAASDRERRANELRQTLFALFAALRLVLLVRGTPEIVSSGAAVTVALHDAANGLLAVAQLGDTEARLYHGRRLAWVSEAHTLAAPGERARFRAAGYPTPFRNSQGQERVGLLCMTRALGDLDLVSAGLSDVPTVEVLETEAGGVYRVELSSDGFWGAGRPWRAETAGAAFVDADNAFQPNAARLEQMAYNVVDAVHTHHAARLLGPCDNVAFGALAWVARAPSAARDKVKERRYATPLDTAPVRVTKKRALLPPGAPAPKRAKPETAPVSAFEGDTPLPDRGFARAPAARAKSDKS